MNINFSSIQQGLEDANVPLGQRSAMVAIGFARALAWRQQLPSYPVENPIEWFNESVKPKVIDALSAINEVFIIDIDRICLLVSSLWMFRYRVLHDPNCDSVRNFLDQAATAGVREVNGDIANLFSQCQATPAFESIQSLIQRSCSKE